MVYKKLIGKNKTLVDEWEEFLRQVRSQTEVDFTMTDEEKVSKLK